MARTLATKAGSRTLLAALLCALLAPLATVSFSSGHIDGALIANTYTGSAQVNSVGFSDPLPAYAGNGSTGTVVVATPEPGSIALFATGVLVIGLFFRRRMTTGAALT